MEVVVGLFYVVLATAFGVALYLLQVIIADTIINVIYKIIVKIYTLLKKEH